MFHAGEKVTRIVGVAEVLREPQQLHQKAACQTRTRSCEYDDKPEM